MTQPSPSEPGLPPHSAVPWPVLRNTVLTVMQLHRPCTCYSQIEMDVTDALAAIARHRRTLGMPVSFHAFVLHCLAQAAAENPIVRTFRHGRRLVTFDDVDIATLIDRKLPNGVRLPIMLTVRSAHTKSLAEINLELRRATMTELPDGPMARLRRRVAGLPAVVRRLIAWRIARDPFLLKRLYGTIGLTSVHVPGIEIAHWPQAPNLHSVSLAVGSIVERVRLDRDGRPVARRVMCLSAGIDHAVIDGAPAARFRNSMQRHIEAARGLDDGFVEDTRRLLAAEPA